MTSNRLWPVIALLVLLAGAIGWRAGLEFGRSQPVSSGAARAFSAARPATGASAAPSRILLPPPEKDILIYEPRNIDELSKAMEQTVSVNYELTSLNSCLEDFFTRYKLPYRIQMKDLEDEGVSPDSPLTLKVDNVRLDSALHLLLQPQQLTWIFENEIIVITTAAKSGESLVTAVYPAGDLAADDADFEELVLCVENGISPDSWDAVGGPGTIQWYLRSKSLSILQTWAVHQEIRRYLRGLREAVAIAETAQRLMASPAPVVETTAIQEARANLARAVIREYNKSQLSGK